MPLKWSHDWRRLNELRESKLGGDSLRKEMNLARRIKKGPPTIPSLPHGPDVLTFSPGAEDTQKVGQENGGCKCAGRKVRKDE